MHSEAYSYADRRAEEDTALAEARVALDEAVYQLDRAQDSAEVDEARPELASVIGAVRLARDAIQPLPQPVDLRLARA